MVRFVGQQWDAGQRNQNGCLTETEEEEEEEEEGERDEGVCCKNCEKTVVNVLEKTCLKCT